MTVQLTSAAERDSRRHSSAAGRQFHGQLLLTASSIVGLLAIGLAYSGRDLKSEATTDSGRMLTAVNLNAVADPVELEAPLALPYPAPADRAVMARALYEFLRVVRDEGRDLPNVGAILRATGVGGTALFSGDQLAAIKPMFAVRSHETYRRRVLIDVLLLTVSFHIVGLVWLRRKPLVNLRLLAGVHLLTAIGFAMLLSRPDPLRDMLLFERYTVSVLTGLAIVTLMAFLDMRRAAFLELSYVPCVTALGLSLLLILFGSGPGASGARVNLGPVQPIEAIRLLMALFLAGYFSRRWELLRQVRLRVIRQWHVPRWLEVPRADYVLPVVAGVGAALGLFFLQKDLGPALFLACVFLAMYGVARGRPTMAVVGLALLVAGFYAGYRLDVSATLAGRVRMWQSPWDNTVRGGAQVAQAIWALATGGVSGTGLGLGDTRYLPAGHTDLVFAEIGEELGAAGLLAVFGLYALTAWRGFRIARAATTDYGFFLATALTLFLILPVLVMGAGVVGLTPLTGVVTPFLSYGGSAMVANYAAVGLLLAIDTWAGAPGTAEPFRLPLRWLGAGLALAGAVVIAALVNVQVLHADEYVARGHLTVQADGVRRFQYNQRLLDVAREIPRGSVFDRDGRVLATGDPVLARRAVADYSSLIPAPDSTCEEPIVRCYPLGGTAFHLLGDATTRTNWSASNTSYVERDAEDALRGFDDHSVVLRRDDSAGGSGLTVRRDYSVLVPLLRHRYQPDHADVRRLFARTRDERISIDARLQVRVARILADYAGRSRDRRAAAIVLDPQSGEILAVASYPWPEVGPDRGYPAAESLLDRARYGLYPPGSTFKLVTATAALRHNPDAQRAAFTCERLSDGRVGAHLNGWSRPVRDDVSDTHAHGTISMRDGLVHSCNAYFAQLAVSIGPAALKETAERLGISVSPGGDADRLRATLPQAGYGQGDVLATPLEMARVASMFADGGLFRAARWRLSPASSDPSKPERVLPQEDADLVGLYLRDAVLAGTGRSLRNNPGRIAGKTGTAEVAGAASHSWFVGFAPYGPAARRIAFAVIIEHAGYGGSAAAPVAGEIVDAAVALGLAR
jgi:cell division protein FtsW (lipid II flippase)